MFYFVDGRREVIVVGGTKAPLQNTHMLVVCPFVVTVM
jgi:hypothetical protein